LAIPFDRSVFLNCPFGETFAPILHAIAFSITDLGYFPRLAPENADNAANRLDRIVELVRASKFGIHDLSRCKALAVGEFARMNMPFELGIDHGCFRFGEAPLSNKAILILEHERYDYQKTLSDISGWDIESHAGDHIKAVRHVSSWLHRIAGAPHVPANRILGNYATFQEWYWEKELAAGASEGDILSYPTIQMVASMQVWVDLGRPV
jgi:hypothetical protein